MKKIIVTGGCGFIGHHLVQHLLINTNWKIIVIDKLNYASNGLERLREIGAVNNKRVKIFPIDFSYEFSEVY